MFDFSNRQFQSANTCVQGCQVARETHSLAMLSRSFKRWQLECLSELRFKSHLHSIVSFASDSFKLAGAVARLLKQLIDVRFRT